MDRFDKNNVGAHIYENLESLTENELLELSQQLDEVPMPMVEGALDEFRREYLPTACEVSLYDLEKEVVRMKRTNIKTLLIAAMITVMMIVSSMVSFAAGAASENSNAKENVTETKDKSEKGELKTKVEIDGLVQELYVIKPLDEFDRMEYDRPMRVEEFIKKGFSEALGYHYSDVDGNVLEFEPIGYNDRYYSLKEEAMQTAREKYGAKFLGEFTGVPINEITELSDLSFSREEAGDYYYEISEGSNYVIESFDPFVKVHKKIFAIYETNFQMETTISIYANCYNAEQDEYQEFVISKTDIGCFEVVFDTPEGWIPMNARVLIENPIVGKSFCSFRALGDDDESPSVIRQKINSALEKHQKEKEEKNDIINKIESNQNK